MNNLSSYCGLTDSRMRLSEKDLPVPFQAWFGIQNQAEIEIIELSIFFQIPIVKR